MDSVMKSMQGQLKELPRRFLERVIARKLRAAGVEDNIIDRATAEMALHIISGNEGALTIEDGGPAKPVVNIVLDDEDLEEIKSQSLEFIASKFPQIIESTAEKSARTLVSELKAKWPDQANDDEAHIAKFMANLDDRWGTAINYIKVILTISRELGDERAKRLKKRKRLKDPSRQEVLWRLHARGCQVVEEIIVLLQSGLADGAMARWRTLHEIDIVSTIITANGESLAQRYIDHQIVESKLAMDEYGKVSPSNQWTIRDREKKRISRAYDFAIAKYGKSFGSPYGWTAELLNKAKPVFGDLVAAANHVKNQPYYRMASHNVHANANGAFSRLGALNDDAVIAGRSNAGLGDPGIKATQSLVLLTISLFGPKFEFVDLVAMKAIAILNDEANREFMRAHRRLARDDAKIRREVKKRKVGAVRSRQTES